MMEGALPFILEAVLVIGLTALVTYLLLERRSQSRIRLAQDEAEQIVADAENRRRAAAIEAKDEAMRLRSELDRELGNRRKEIDRIERRMEQKEENIDRKLQSVEQRDQNVRKNEQNLERSKEAWENERSKQQAKLDQERNRHIQELERVAGLTAEEARNELVAEVEGEARAQAARRVHEIEQ